MSPKFGDIAELKAVLLAAKRAHDFGRGSPDEKLKHVEPLIDALSKSLQQSDADEALAHQLMATLRLSPVYSQDPSQGDEPIALRWTVARQPAFHHCIELLRKRFPQESEFVS